MVTTSHRLDEALECVGMWGGDGCRGSCSSLFLFQGYLGRVLAQQCGLRVLGLERESSRTVSARERSKISFVSSQERSKISQSAMATPHVLQPQSTKSGHPQPPATTPTPHPQPTPLSFFVKVLIELSSLSNFQQKPYPFMHICKKCTTTE